MTSPVTVALIPARAGSKRLAGKNVRPLAGHPLVAYTIAAARDSGIFTAVVVSTDSPDIAEIARHYGADVPFLRPRQMAEDLSPDIEWVRHALNELSREGRAFPCFSILRPTSPFRSGATIRRAWDRFGGRTDVDSLRAVEPCRQHPGKMWRLEGDRLVPLLDGGPSKPPWHSMAYQALPRVFVQNASLEIAWSRVPLEEGTIAGTRIIPFFTEGYEGVDLNDERDWLYAEQLVAAGTASLPSIRQPAIGSQVIHG
ncbi:MAG TPA: acylneuraminate cytidylyltransferase family protein [Gemmatimonadales bacterium]|nr:acylneuraminate cytidylyltransferase family protein [Gemmatimonadales bacterium]